jgi:uncharacterized membrane protein YvbJ
MTPVHPGAVWPHSVITIISFYVLLFARIIALLLSGLIVIYHFSNHTSSAETYVSPYFKAIKGDLEQAYTSVSPANDDKKVEAYTGLGMT